MAEYKTYSIQPRFRITSPTIGGWAMVDAIMRTGTNAPSYGTVERDLYLSVSWMNDPMLAGAFSTWIEKLQTINWRIIGGRNKAMFYAREFNKAEQGKGWSYFNGLRGGQYLYTDKGAFTELGRVLFSKGIENEYEKLNELIASGDYSPVKSDNKVLEAIHNKLTIGPVSGIQHVDSSRMYHTGIPRFTWRYFPYNGLPVSYPDDNILQISSMPNPLDRYKGYGYCAMSRLLDMKQLMVGYLNYFRQEIGDLPPEMAVIINGLPETYIKDSLTRYKQEKIDAGLDEYGKIWWLGSDDPSSPIQMDIKNLITPGKSFDYKSFIETWAKMIAINTGEDVGEFWLIQHSGAVKSVQSIQAMKSRGKGVARFLQEDERLLNLYVLPMGVKFEYDNKDDDQDRQKQEILGLKIANLKELAAIGVDREDPIYTIDQLREMATEWEIVPTDMDAKGPSVIGATLKNMYSEDIIMVNGNDLSETVIKPMLTGKIARDAEFIVDVINKASTALKNGHHEELITNESNGI